MKYLVIVEKAGNNYSAYIPDIPGCVATGKTQGKAHKELIKVFKMHLKGMEEDGLSIPKPAAEAEYIDLSRKKVA